MKERRIGSKERGVGRKERVVGRKDIERWDRKKRGVKQERERQTSKTEK